MKGKILSLDPGKIVQQKDYCPDLTSYTHDPFWDYTFFKCLDFEFWSWVLFIKKKISFQFSCFIFFWWFHINYSHIYLMNFFSKLCIAVDCNINKTLQSTILPICQISTFDDDCITKNFYNIWIYVVMWTTPSKSKQWSYEQTS